MCLQKTRGKFEYVVCAVVVALIFFLPAASPAVTMHVILAGDTLDPNIGESVQQDLNNVTKWIETIAQKTGMEYAGYLLDGDGLKSSSLNDVLRKLTVAPDDLIFFYYSGHGGRYESTPTKWPLLYFPDQLVDLQQVLDALLAKHPRLLIALADCCNSYIDEPSAQKSAPQMKKLEPSAESYKKLFLYPRGYYIVSGSVPGEPSIALRDGGMLTTDFLLKADRQIASGNPRWQNLQTTVLTAPNGEQQHPQYDIKIETSAAAALTPTVKPTLAPIASPTPTQQPPTPTPTPKLIRLPTAIPTAPPLATPTPWPTLTPLPMLTPTPLPTPIPIPTRTPFPMPQWILLPTAPRTPTPFPTLTPTPLPLLTRPQPAASLESIIPPASPIQTHSGKNLLRNGDFRKSTANWKFRGTTLLVKNVQRRSVLVTNDGDYLVAEPGVYQDVAGVKKGRTVTFDAVVCSPTLPRTITLVIWELSKKSQLRYAEQFDLAESCERLSISYPKQASATTLRVEIQYARGNPPADIYVSDAWLQ